MKLSNKVILILSTLLVGMILAGYKSDIAFEVLKEKYANADSKFITVDSIEVHYRDQGTGPPLLLIHGTGASLHTWDAWTETLKTEFRIIRLDIPAFGLTGPSVTRDYSLESYAKFVRDFMQKIGIPKAHVAGNSLGGAIAWNLALLYPAQVDKLVLIDASGYPKETKSPWIFRLAKNELLGPILKNFTPEFIFRKNLQAVYFDDTKITNDLVKRYHELTLRPGNRQAFIDRSKTSYTGNSNKISEISQKTLVQWGAHDEWVPVTDAHKFAEEIPAAELIIYQNAGHVPMEEIPVVSALDAKAFLLQE